MAEDRWKAPDDVRKQAEHLARTSSGVEASRFQDIAHAMPVGRTTLLALLASGVNGKLGAWATRLYHAAADAASDVDVRVLTAAGIESPCLDACYGIVDGDRVTAVIRASTEGTERWTTDGWQPVPPDLEPVGFNYRELAGDILTEALAACADGGGLMLRAGTPKAFLPKRIPLTVTAGAVNGVYAAVDEADTTAVLNIFHVADGTVSTRHDGEWVPDRAVLTHLLASGVPLALLPGADVAPTLRQVDDFDAVFPTFAATADSERVPDLAEDLTAAVGKVYHFKHGWIPLDHVDAPAAQAGNAELVQRGVVMHGSDRSKWPAANLKSATRFGDEQARTELARRVKKAAAAKKAASVKASAGPLVSDVAPAQDEVTPIDEPDPTPDFSDGVMVALPLDDATAQQLAVPGGLDPAEMHVTLAYLGNTGDCPVDADTLAGLVAEWAAGQQPLSGEVSGPATFEGTGNADNPVHVALADVPGLPEARQSLIDHLSANGVKQQSDHAFTPHISRAYSTDPVPTDGVGGTPLNFGQVGVWHGSNQQNMPLGPVAAAFDPNEARGFGGKWTAGQANALEANRKTTAPHAAPKAKTVTAKPYKSPKSGGGGASKAPVKAPPVKASAEPLVADAVAHTRTPRQLEDYWVRGAGAARVAWSTPGDWARCVAQLGAYVHNPHVVKGQCNELHKIATGLWPAQHAKLDRGK